MGRVDNGTRIFDSDFILYRYGEAFLMAAEARYYGKDYAGALEALAPLAARAYGRKDYYTDTSPEAVLQAIVDEYLREMVGEGRTWWMLLRTDEIWEYSADIAAQRDKNPNILLWPITQAAMSRNYTPPYKGGDGVPARREEEPAPGRRRACNRACEPARKMPRPFRGAASLLGSGRVRSL